MPDETTTGPPYATDRETLERESTVDFLRGSGPGGQHRNRRETAVRLTHAPSGVVVTASERRSQHQNLEAAYERLRARLEELNEVPTPRKRTRRPRSVDRRRVEEKRRTAQKKALRRPPSVDDG